MGQRKGGEKSKVQTPTTLQQNEKKNSKDKNDKNRKKSKVVSSSSFAHPSVVLFVFISLPCLFLAGMLLSSLISPAADAFWHRHFWYRILPLPSKEYLQKNPWAALAMEIVGTQLGNWTWANEVPWTGLTAWNPPLLVGAFYCFGDLLVNMTVVRFEEKAPVGVSV